MNMANAKAHNRKMLNIKNTVFIWFAIIAVLFAELFVYTLIRTESVNTALRISKAGKLFTNQQSYNEALLMEREWLKSYDQLIELTNKYFDLSPVILDRVIYIE